MDMNTSIIALLDELAGLRSAHDALRLMKEEAIDAAIPDDIRDAVRKYRELVYEVEAEFSDKLEAANTKQTEIEQAIRDAVVNHGQTVRGEYLTAVYMKGRVSWDSGALEGYAAAHPEIIQFRKEGAPSVSLRPVKS